MLLRPLLLWTLLQRLRFESQQCQRDQACVRSGHWSQANFGDLHVRCCHQRRWNLEASCRQINTIAQLIAMRQRQATMTLRLRAHTASSLFTMCRLLANWQDRVWATHNSKDQPPRCHLLCLRRTHGRKAWSMVDIPSQI